MTTPLAPMICPWRYFWMGLGSPPLGILVSMPTNLPIRVRICMVCPVTGSRWGDNRSTGIHARMSGVPASIMALPWILTQYPPRARIMALIARLSLDSGWAMPRDAFSSATTRPTALWDLVASVTPVFGGLATGHNVRQVVRRLPTLGIWLLLIERRGVVRLAIT